MKTNLKKILAAILAISAVVSASGCNIVVDEGSSSTSSSSGVALENSSSSNSSSDESSSSNSGTNDSTSSEESSSSVESSSSQESSSTTENIDPNEGEMSGSILVLNDGRGIVLYGGGKANGKEYASYLNTIKSNLANSGNDINVYSLVSPTAGSYYLPDKYKGYMASEKDNIDNINANLSGVTPVDVYSVFEQHKSEHIFSRTDHHWQPLGAYYAAQELAKVAGVPFAPLSEYVEHSYEGYVGTLYGYSKENPKIKNNPEPFTYYSPKCDYTATFSKTGAEGTFKEGSLLLPGIFKSTPVSWYLVFIGTDDIVTRVNTTVNNGRKLLIVKDSYGNAVIPCLLSSFEQVDMVDMRYFKGSVSQYAVENGMTDIVFIMNTFSATGPNEKKLANII